MAARKYSAYICPGCGDELTAYDAASPTSVTDPEPDRREDDEHYGNFFCAECDLDYEPVTAIDSRDVEPLAEAVREFLRTQDHSLPVETGAYEEANAIRGLRAALAPFLDGGEK